MPAEEVKSKRPLDTKFRQQKLPAWRPILTPTAVIVAFLAVGTVFLPIGGVVYLASSKVEEVETVDYAQQRIDGGDGGCCISNCSDVDSQRVDSNPCFLTIDVKADMEPPIYMYYKLTRFYQNHRMYVKSRFDPQLAGESGLTPGATEATCKVASSKSNVGWARGDGSTVADAVSPCGLIAFSLFNDSFRLEEATPGGDWRPVKQTSEGIAWQSDVDVKFKNAEDGSTGENFPGFAREKTLGCDTWPVDGSTPDAATTAACLAAKTTAADSGSGLDPGWCYRGSKLCMEDEHFIVWMRTAGLPNFRKLFAKIDEKLYADKTYRVNIWNGFEGSPYSGDTSAAGPHLFPVHTFKGEKYVVLSTTEWIGGRNDFLGIAYLIVGSLCIVLALVFFIKSQCSPAQELGSVASSATAKESS